MPEHTEAELRLMAEQARTLAASAPDPHARLAFAALARRLDDQADALRRASDAAQ